VELRKRFVVFNLKPNTTIRELRWHLTPERRRLVDESARQLVASNCLS
jgi:hypothetical protein